MYHAGSSERQSHTQATCSTPDAISNAPSTTSPQRSSSAASSTALHAIAADKQLEARCLVPVAPAPCVRALQRVVVRVWPATSCHVGLSALRCVTGPLETWGLHTRIKHVIRNTHAPRPSTRASPLVCYGMFTFGIGPGLSTATLCSSSWCQQYGRTLKHECA